MSTFWLTAPHGRGSENLTIFADVINEWLRSYVACSRSQSPPARPQCCQTKLVAEGGDESPKRPSSNQVSEVDKSASVPNISLGKWAILDKRRTPWFLPLNFSYHLGDMQDVVEEMKGNVAATGWTAFSACHMHSSLHFPSNNIFTNWVSWDCLPIIVCYDVTD